jgi:hypothetical protein
MMDSTLEIGSELGRIGDTGTRNPIRLNGEAIFVSSTVANVGIDDLLDRVEAKCRDNPTELVDAMATLPNIPREQIAALTSREAGGVVRYDNGEKGAIFCFENPEGKPAGLRDRMERISKVLETGDLSHLGNARYVFAEATDAGLTHVVTAWTEGSFNLYNLVPGDGDAPGSDLEGVPRPLRSVRLLTAGADGVPYSARIYDTPVRAEVILEDYDREMVERGWEPMIVDHKGLRRVYGKNGTHVYVLPREDRGRTLVTLLQMRGTR